MAKFKLSSSVFGERKWIPKEYTKDGLDQSPPLQWEGLPSGTKELALVCEDPDAPRPEPWVHWLIYKIAPTVNQLRPGLPPTEKLEDPPNALQGTNSYGDIGYGGPQPPPNGAHRYYFRLYALKNEVSLLPGASKEECLRAIEDSVIEVAELVGKYQRETQLKAG